MDISLGVDALIKIIDTNGQDMGQAYLNLNPFLSPDKLGASHTLQVISYFSSFFFLLLYFYFNNIHLTRFQFLLVDNIKVL